MPDRIESIRRTFDERAGSYDESAMHRDLASAVARFVDLGGVRNVIDVATGTGLVLRALAERSAGARLLGVDISRGMLSVARTALPDAEWIEAEASSLPFASSSADLMTCVTALHIIPDVPAALDEWRRTLRPDGRLVTATFASTLPAHGSDVTDDRPYPRDHAPYATPDAIASALAPHDFTLSRFEHWADATDTVLLAEFVAGS